MTGRFEDHIGGIVRVDYIWLGQNGKAGRIDKSRPCVVVRAQGDNVLVAPITHSAERAGEAGTKLPLPASEMRRAGLSDEGESYVALQQVNIVHVNSSALRPHRDGSWVKGRLSNTVVKQIQAVHEKSLASKALKMKIQPDDTSAFAVRNLEPRTAESTGTRDRHLEPGHPDKAAERDMRAREQARNLAAKRDIGHARPTLTLKKPGEGRPKDTVPIR